MSVSVKARFLPRARAMMNRSKINLLILSQYYSAVMVYSSVIKVSRKAFISLKFLSFVTNIACKNSFFFTTKQL